MDYGTLLKNLDNRIWEIIKTGIHTAFPALVDYYDGETGTARVIPQIQFVTKKGEYINYPPLNGVPVVFPQSWGGDATIAYPIKNGDGCLVVCAEQCLDYWRFGNQTGNNVKFNISNAICIVGMFSKANEAMAEATKENAVVVKVKDSKLIVKEDQINIKSNKINIVGDVVVDGKVTSSGDVVAKNRISLAEHTHTESDGGKTSKPN